MTPKYSCFSAVVPSYNESATIAHVIDELLLVPHLDELIVVNDGGTDATIDILRPYIQQKKIILINHEKNKGKGSALKTGLKRAKNEIILFLDADLKNITTHKISKIVEPVLSDEVDLSRASFALARGRVTEIAIKPMMRILFPDQNFDQPITGQICGKKSFFSSVDLVSKWGVDIGILLDAIEAGQRIIEIDIGKLEHKARTDAEKAEMAQQVLETMIKKAGLIQHKYKLVIFTLDQTLIPSGSMTAILKKLGIEKETREISRKLAEAEITNPEYILQTAERFKGLSLQQIEDACATIKLEPYTTEVLRALRQRKFEIAITSPVPLPIVGVLAKRLGVKIFEGIELKATSRGVLTGEITARSKQHWLNSSIEQSMFEATKRIMRRCQLKLAEIVIVASSYRTLPIFEKAGLSLAYRPTNKELKLTADKTITVLAEVLALVE